ncbi:amino acid adenylation domain-containing protein [Streptomyces sp. NPDC054841]
MGTHPSRTVQQPTKTATPVQEYHYVRQELAGDGAACTVQAACWLTESMDLDSLRDSAEAVIRRHPSLQTRFCFEGTALLQIADPLLSLDWRVEERRDANDETAADWLYEQGTRAFDLHEGPLVRAALLRTSDTRALLALTGHRAVTDQRSLYAVLRQTVTAASGGTPADLADAWPTPDGAGQEEWLDGEEATAHRAFWADELSGDLPRHVLSWTDNEELAAPGRPKRASSLLPAQAVEELADICTRNGTSLHVGLLTAYSILIGRYTATDDVLVRAQPRQDNPELLAGLGQPPTGPAPNELVIRTDLSHRETFLGLLSRVDATLRRTHGHRALPFPCVLREAGLDWPEEHDSVLPFSFTTVTTEDEESDARDQVAFQEHLDRLDVRPVDVAPCPTPVLAGTGVHLTVRATSENPTVTLDGYLSPQWRERFLHHFCTLLADIAADPGKVIDDLTIFTPAEHAALHPLPQSTGTADGGPTCYELFTRHAHEHPDRVAVSGQDEHMTYRELNERANRLARHLRAAGVNRNTLVGLGMPRSSDLVVGILAIHKAGGAYVPLDPAYPDSRLEYIVRDTDLTLVLVRDEQEAARYRGITGTIVVLQQDRDAIDRQPATALEPSATQDDLAYVIHTSGSTGRPKGTLVSHRNLSRLFTQTAAWFSFGAADVWTLFHSYAFDFSVWELWGALRHGGRLVVVPEDTVRSPGDFHRLLRQERVTVLNQTPSAFSVLIHADEQLGAGEDDDALRLRYVIFGGEALEPRSLRPWIARHGLDRPKLVNMYGITETTVHVTHHVLSATDLDDPGPAVIGEPIPDLSLAILDAYGRPVPVGVPGELYVSGAGVTRGYLGRPDLQAERFLTHPADPRVRTYRTGDVVRRRSNGALEYRGRMDDQVKIRGFRIEPGEITATLLAQADVREATVLVRETRSGKELVAYVVPSRPGVKPEELRASLVGTLPVHLIPGHFVLMAAFPLTPNGKVDKAQLPPPGQPSTSTAHFSAMETKVAAVWAEVLEIQQVGLDDNYFLIGGDSIRLISILSRSRELGLDVELSDLLAHQTVRELAAHLVQAKASAG